MAAPRRIQVPEGLKEILQDFVVSVLRNQTSADEIPTYAAQYFATKIGMRLVSANLTSQQSQPTESFVAGEYDDNTAPVQRQQSRPLPPPSPSAVRSKAVSPLPESHQQKQPSSPQPPPPSPSPTPTPARPATTIDFDNDDNEKQQRQPSPQPPPSPLPTTRTAAEDDEQQVAAAPPEPTDETDDNNDATTNIKPSRSPLPDSSVEAGYNVYHEENGLDMPPPTEGYTADPTAPTLKLPVQPSGGDGGGSGAGSNASRSPNATPSALMDAEEAANDNTNQQKSSANINRNKSRTNESAEEAEDQLPDMRTNQFLPPPARNKARRQSVSAESYDPSKDDSSEKQLPKFPKTEQEMETLREAMSKALIFRSLDPNQLSKVADAVRPVTYNTGDTVIREGDENANDFYVIESGTLDIYKTVNGEQKLMGTYENSGAFGELSLLYNQPRAATIKCTTDAKLWALDRQTFQIIVVRAAYKKRQLYMEIMDKVDFLSELTSFEKQNVCDALRPKYFNADSVIMRQGEVADGMYFIEEGTCHVYRHNNSNNAPPADADATAEDKEIKVLSRGDYFGELALITKKPRAATVKPEGKVKLAFLDTSAFERLCGPCVGVMQRNIDKYENQLNKLGMQGLQSRG